MSMKCIHCKVKELTGKQTRFCSKVCKSRYSNSWHNSAIKQKQKGVDKKTHLIKLLGEMKCGICGYSKNLSGLTFHHKNPTEKAFSLDQRSCSMLSMKRLIVEAKKCQVLCMNCHMELHHPQHEIGGPRGNRTPI